MKFSFKCWNLNTAGLKCQRIPEFELRLKEFEICQRFKTCLGSFSGRFLAAESGEFVHRRGVKFTGLETCNILNIENPVFLDSKSKFRWIENAESKDKFKSFESKKIFPGTPYKILYSLKSRQSKVESAKHTKMKKFIPKQANCGACVSLQNHRRIWFPNSIWKFIWKPNFHDFSLHSLDQASQKQEFELNF